MITFPVTLFSADSGFVIDLEADSSQYLSIASGSQTGLAITSNISLESWVNLESKPTSSNTVAMVMRGSNYRFRYQDNNLLHISYQDTVLGGIQTHTSPQTFNTGTWIHTGVTVDFTSEAESVTVQYFIDGSFVDSDGPIEGYNLIGGAQDLNVGYDSVSGLYLDGMLDEIRIWDDVRTSTEIGDNYNIKIDPASANLVAYWQFDNEDATDSTSNGNDLTENNSPVYSNNTPF